MFRAHGPQQEKLLQLEAHTLQLESSLHSAQLETPAYGKLMASLLVAQYSQKQIS